jgi:CysZ protein
MTAFPPPRPPRRGNALQEFASGIWLLLRGFGLYGRNPGLVLLGLLPAAIASILLLVVFGLLIYFIGDISSALTWFADDWSPAARDLARLAAGVALIGVCALLAVVTFTSLTLAIGDPFYEKISERVEARLGGVPNAVARPWYRELARGAVEALRLAALSALIGIPLFVAGFLPVIGQTVVPVIGALFGGWFLAIELVGVPFARRGYRLADRRRALRTNRPLAVGFGAAAFACFLIPFGAVLAMPAAVAGGTLLARRVLGQPDQPATDGRLVPIGR